MTRIPLMMLTVATLISGAAALASTAAADNGCASVELALVNYGNGIEAACANPDAARNR